jgi:hypothetical protein
MATPLQLSARESGPSEPEIDYQTLAEVYTKWDTCKSPEEKLLEAIIGTRTT